MVAWFEKSKEIILSRGNSKDEAVINMIEDLFDLLMVIHDINDEGKRQVVESFVPRICVLVIDARVNICIQQETLKKMNAMLDKMPQEARKILFNQEMLILMSSLGERILDAGDYDLQVGIVEALCRMTTEKQRQELACQWFSMDFIANAFKGIKDSEFETDCRVFLNLVNGMLGDKRRVFTFPCISAFLDKYELQIPSDEKLEEFWIDFNLGSQTLSFYVAGNNDDHQWEAVTVPEDKVQIYSIEVRESKKLLTIILKNIAKISKREGKELLLYFDASLEITTVTQKIFGANKYREFTRKQGISVAKTSVHILFDASGSQILVPESQISPIEEELITLKEKPNSQKEFAKPPKYIKNSNQGDRKNSQLETITPSKRKMSEASMIVPGTDRYTVRSPILLINTSTPRRGRIKPPLQMMSSAEKPDIPKTSESGVDNAVFLISRPSEGRNSGDNTDKHNKMAKVVKKTENKDVEFPNQNINDLQDIVPDSQAVEKIDKPVLRGVLDNICGNKMPSKWSCWTPVTNINLCNNQRADTSSGDTFNQDVTVNKKLRKQKSSSSISEDNSEETEKRGKSKEKGFTDAAESLINQINKRYKPKESTRKFKESLIDSGFSNKSDLQLSKEKVQKKSYRQLKTTLVNVTSECPLNDVYNFNLNGADEPIIKLGIQEFQATATEACVDNSIKLIGLRNHDELETSLKTKDKRTVTNPKKKNLFSDTDAEYRCDDSKTDVSWLKEPKSKPQLIDYSRNKNVKKPKSGKSKASLERGQPRPKVTPNKNITKKVEETVPDGRTRLPRRVAKTKKNYKDLSNSESESEQEFSHSFKEKLLVKEENIHSRSKTMKLSKKQQNTFSAETQKDVSKEWKNSSLLKDAIRDNSLGLSPISLSGSPSSIEVMRCTEKRERDVPQDYDRVTKSLSPSPKTSSPESLGSKYRVGGPKKSPKNSDRNLCARESCSPIPQSFLLGSHSASPLSPSSEGREQTWCDMPCESPHVSGPTQHLSRKRMYIEDNLSNADEIQLEEEEEGRVYLLPKKLSKTEDRDHHTYKVSGSVSPLSTNDFSIHGESWESEISGLGVMCESLDTEFRRKFHIRQKMMDYFTKQSWKTAQQHLNTMNHQIQEYRIKKLDKFQFIIIEELENFEKDSQSLKDLEKEFVDFWKKTFQKFNAYQKSEQQRLHLLKASLDKNVFYNTDYEDTVFTSEMCSLKENMKMLQDRLLKETQEEELLNVRRGLMSLFMAHERNVRV
ncbi:synaptonemal complex protein 2 [Eumetopias jubatus]|uniref:synaptonemal complex protein 2 n=1 Tax=Eumetopias jubatus TaxID=34886 RepID=UPI00101696E8|nr:synaptonemal complex protein 2 [Eumetopias jubatus]